VRQDDDEASGEALIVRHAVLDDIDELPPPRPLDRYCGAPGCRRRVRPGGRHCSSCHAASVRRWREEHAHELAVRRRDAAGTRDDETRGRDSARAKLAMALRRGKISRGHCTICGAKDAMALIEDWRRPLEITWACRADRETARERRREDAALHVAEAERVLWLDERARALAGIETLAADDRALLHHLAGRGPAGLRLSPESPLFVINLVRQFQSLARSKGT